MPSDDDAHRSGAKLYLGTTGFPSPADDATEHRIHLGDLIRNPASTFFLLVKGSGLVQIGICPGDLLVVDRARAARHGRVIVFVHEEELVVRRLLMRNGTPHLVTGNPADPPIVSTEEQPLRIWGVVTHMIRSLIDPFPDAASHSPKNRPPRPDVL